MREWKRVTLAALDGIEAHLCPSAPQSARTALARLRSEVREGTQKAVEPQIEALLRSKPYYRAAWRRYVSAYMKTLLPELKEVVEGLCAQLRTYRESTADAEEQK